MFRRDGMQPGSGGNVARSVVDMPDRCYADRLLRREYGGEKWRTRGPPLALVSITFSCLTAHAFRLYRYIAAIMFTLADKTRD